MNTPIRLSILGLCATSLLCLQIARADDSTTNTPPPPGGHPHDRGHGFFLPGFDKLDLTDAQKEQIKQIIKQTEEERRQKIDAVLTPDQLAKLQAIIAAHKAHEHNSGNAAPSTDSN